MRRGLLALLIAIVVLTPACAGGEAAGRFAPLADALSQDRAPAAIASAIGRAEWPRVQAFFKARQYQRAWTSGSRPNAAFHDAVAVLERAGEDALNPEQYDLDWLRAERKRLTGLLSRQSLEIDDELVELEVRTTAALLRWARHLAAGRFDPSDGETWLVEPREPAPEAIVAQAVADGQIDELPSMLRPPHGEYNALLELRERYLERAKREQPPPLRGRGLVRPGQSHESVPALRARLAAEGDLSKDDATDSREMDEEVVGALRKFQNRHGLTSEGILGPATRAALNVTPAERLRQIGVNIERWRFAPRDLGARHIRVNIPAYYLALVDDGVVVVGMRAVIGSKEWPTPVLSDEMRSIVFSPYWVIPQSIVADEVLPRLLSDPDYLARNDIELVRVIDGRVEVVDPSESDWLGFDDSLRLRQRPGAGNALGNVKFALSNHLNIYLHDTPAGGVFDRLSRALSHGCVRVERPVTLAQHLLADQGWDQQRIRSAMEQGEEQWLKLREPVPVHLMYVTAWVDEEGRPQFRPDVYGLDAAHARALEDVIGPPERDVRPEQS